MKAPLLLNPQPGDVLCTRRNTTAGYLIGIGAALLRRPCQDDHVAVVHHTDAHGTTWCLEGRPGGVGWRDARTYLASRWTVSNMAQPKTSHQRAKITETVKALVGTPYDWEAIAADGLAAFHLDGLWHPSWHGTVPGHVVCSSLAAYAYHQAQVPAPPGGREVTPGDWVAFIIEHGWRT